MKRSLAALSLVFLVASAAPANAAPVINAASFGIELCPQSICGSAIFTGLVYGQVGANPAALGTFAVAVTHDDLPTVAGDTAAVTGGVFEIRAGLRTIKGVVGGGTLQNLGDNTFKVTMILVPAGGGLLVFEGVLDHNVFPPTVKGRIVSLF